MPFTPVGYGCEMLSQAATRHLLMSPLDCRSHGYEIVDPIAQ